MEKYAQVTATRAWKKAVEVKHAQFKYLKSKTESILGINIFLIGDNQ